MTPHATITEELIEQNEQPYDSTEYTATEDRSNYSHNVPSDWLIDVWKQLQAIKALPDGWDSYGAPSPDSHKMEAAWRLIRCLHEDPDLPKPHVNPTRDGGVQFEWEVGQRYFEIEVEAERAATYLFCDDDEHVEETGEISESEFLDPVLNYIHRVGATK